MPSFITTIALAIGISSADTIVLGVYLLILIIFLAIGISKSYATFFGMLIGFGVYLTLRTLLLSTTGSDSLFSPVISKFLVGSSAHLILILAILTPLGETISISGAKNIVLRILENLAITTISLVFFVALFYGFATKAYVFDVDMIFAPILKINFVQLLFSQSKILIFIVREMRSIVVLSVLFAIYKALFADITEAMIQAAWKAILKARKSGTTESVPSGEEAFEEEFHDANEMFDDHGNH